MRYTLLVVACVALLVGMAFTRERALAQGAPQQTRWEYGKLIYGIPPAPRCTWQDRNSSVNGDSLDILKAIGGKPRSNKGVMTIEILNALGDQGWELVQYREDAADRITSAEYVFKRHL